MYFCNVKPDYMDFKERYHQLFQQSIHVLLEPKKFWGNTREEDTALGIFKYYFLPLVFLVGLAIFLGELITSSEFLLSYAVAKSIREVVSYILQYYLSVYVLNELLTSFGGVKDKIAVSRLMAYSLLPFLLVSFVTGLFPALYVLNVLGIYSIVLFVMGVKSSLNIPSENKNRYIMIAFLLVFLIFALLNVFSWKLFQAFYGYGA